MGSGGGEDGGMDLDPNMDPELAMVSQFKSSHVLNLLVSTQSELIQTYLP